MARINGAYEVITMNESWHGRTLAMTAANGQPALQDQFKPLIPGFVNVPLNSMDAIKKATNENLRHYARTRPG